MKKQKVFVLFSHPSQEAEYEIWCMSSDIETVLNKCIDLDLKDIYDEENDQVLDSGLIQKSKRIDFGFIDDNRFVLKSFEAAVPADNELYAVFVNGEDEYSWEAELEALFASRPEAIDYVAERLSEFEDADQVEEYRKQFADIGNIIDANFTYWNIVKIHLS